MPDDRPIGLFDSGVGGLGVLHECVLKMPNERFIYLADRANMPYGERPPDRIRAAALDCANRLVALNCKAIVVACNTATENAIDEIRRQFPLRVVVGLEPAIKPCCMELGRGYAVALVTKATEMSPKFKLLMSVYGDRVVVVGCHDLARLIERNSERIEKLRPAVNEILSPYADAEAVVLGCSHYTFITGLIREFYADRIKIYDGAVGAAARLKYCLAVADILAPKDATGSIRFYTTHK